MRRNLDLLAGVVATLSLALALALWAYSDDESQSSPSEERIALGAALYADHCASCHGADLEGAANWRNFNADGTLKPPPHDASGHTWHHSDAQLFTYTKLGGAAAMADMPDFKSGMPGFGDVLTDDEIRAVLDFIKSTWPTKIRDAQTERSRQDAS